MPLPSYDELTQESLPSYDQLTALPSYDELNAPSTTPATDAAVNQSRETQRPKADLPEWAKRPLRSAGQTAIGLVKGIPTMANFIRDPFSRENLAEIAKQGLATGAQMKQLSQSKPFSQPWWDAFVPLATQEAMIVGGVRGSAPAIEKPPIQGGETDASSITGAEGTPQREVRPQVGEEAPLRQQGETPAPQETQQAEVEPQTFNIRGEDMKAGDPVTWGELGGSAKGTIENIEPYQSTVSYKTKHDVTVRRDTGEVVTLKGAEDYGISKGGDLGEVQRSQESGQGQRGETGSQEQDRQEGVLGLKLSPEQAAEPESPFIQGGVQPPAEGGPSIRAVEDRPIEAPPPGKILGWERATAYGDNWLNQGGDINKVVTDFRKTGKVDEREMGKMNAYLNRLQSVTNQAGDALRTAPNSPKLQQAYQAAVDREQAFSEAYKPMHTVASGSLAALQGHVPLTEEAAASFTGLKRRFEEYQGRPMSAAEVVKADKISRQAEKANGEYARANGEVYRQLDNEYGRMKTTRKGPPTRERLAKVFGEPFMEVCD